MTIETNILFIPSSFNLFLASVFKYNALKRAAICMRFLRKAIEEFCIEERQKSVKQ